MIESNARPEAPLWTQGIRARVCEAAFGERLISNHFRGLVAEAIVASVLEPEWTWCSADWARWDFERADGLRLEVKQSASRQTWSTNGAARSACRFDIRARAGTDAGSPTPLRPARAADLYIFAHHFEFGDAADHGDPTQWRFFVISEHRLPLAQTIGLPRIAKLARPSNFAHVAADVNAVAREQTERSDKAARQRDATQQLPKALRP